MKSLTDIILELPGQPRSHRALLHALVKETCDEIKVASAYVTDRELLLAGKNRKRKLLTSIDPMDIASGATSLECLRALLDSEVEIRYTASHPRLHAKVYLFGERQALVTSANMTRNAMEFNLEVGVNVFGADTIKLHHWFDEVWDDSERLSIDILANLSSKVPVLRREFTKFKAQVTKSLGLPSKETKKLSNAFTKTLNNCKNFYLLNTNRRYDYKTETGGYGMEERMLDCGQAVVWGDFNFPSHISAVRPGDVIFAFAKKVGIIAVGVAEAEVARIEDHSDQRIRSYTEFPFPEWRVSTHWFIRVDSEDALPYTKAPNASFIDVSGEKYAELRKAIRMHFAV